MDCVHWNLGPAGPVRYGMVLYLSVYPDIGRGTGNGEPMERVVSCFIFHSFSLSPIAPHAFP
jgi:hypothetical protein